MYTCNLVWVLKFPPLPGLSKAVKGISLLAP